MAPDLFYSFRFIVIFVAKFPNDIRETIFGVVEERPEVVLPSDG